MTGLFAVLFERRGYQRRHRRIGLWPSGKKNPAHRFDSGLLRGCARLVPRARRTPRICQRKGWSGGAVAPGGFSAESEPSYPRHRARRSVFLGGGGAPLHSHSLSLHGQTPTASGEAPSQTPLVPSRQAAERSVPTRQSERRRTVESPFSGLHDTTRHRAT